MKNGKKIKVIIGVLIIIFSSIITHLSFYKIVNISAGDWTGNEVDLMNSLHKYKCSVDYSKDENNKTRHFITDEKCDIEGGQ